MITPFGFRRKAFYPFTQSTFRLRDVKLKPLAARPALVPRTEHFIYMFTLQSISFAWTFVGARPFFCRLTPLSTSAPQCLSRPRAICSWLQVRLLHRMMPNGRIRLAPESRLTAGQTAAGPAARRAAQLLLAGPRCIRPRPEIKALRTIFAQGAGLSDHSGL